MADNSADRATRLTNAREAIGYPFLFRLLHWLVGGSVLVSILTGLSLHAVSRPEWSLFGGELPSWFWAGRVNLWHLVSATVFAPSAIATLWIFRWGRFWRRPTLVVLLVGGVLMVITGLSKIDCFNSYTLHSIAVYVHAVLGVVLIPIAFLWHTICGLTIYWRHLVSSFQPWAKPQAAPVLQFILLAVVTTCLILNGLPAHPSWRDLHASRIPTADIKVNELAALPWGDAERRVVHLANGSGCRAGQTEVTLRALHDDRCLFVMAEWLDDREDRQYIPWRQVGRKWEHLRTGPSGGPQFDETRYYEDKMSLIFPDKSDWTFNRVGCAAHCHVDAGRGYGYKASKLPVDVWHWKATRTDPVGQVDDKYWFEADFESKDVGRYGDPKTGGGYSTNMAEDETHPAFLPDDLAAVRGGIIPAEHAVEYSEEAAEKIPQGTIIPGVVASQFEGDRGDVLCSSRHEDGRWTVYMRRELDTGSEHDMKFVPGQSYPFGCAVFDRCSKRHAYNLLAYRLVLEP